MDTAKIDETIIRLKILVQLLVELISKRLISKSLTNIFSELILK